MYASLSYLWIVVNDIAHVTSTSLTIGLLVIVLSFLKSLQPRYNFCNGAQTPEANDEQRRERRNEVRDLSNARPITRAKSFLSEIGNEFRRIEESCSLALTNANIQSVYRQLPWSQTQIDVESVNWLNQTLKTLWPSVKNILNTFVFKDLLKPKAHNHRAGSKEKSITIERIKLGDSMPTVNSIKFIEENGVFSGRHMVSSDENNMRFVIELSYKTDRKFLIQVSSLPILNCIKLTKFNFQFRLLLTVNHTTAGLNEDLKILETPDDEILFPAINYVQVTLVDVPKIDWRLGRPCVKAANSPEKREPYRRIGCSANSIRSTLGHYLDPIHIINHSYFKYLLHSTLYLALKWFQPFEVKVGSHLYIKTIC